MTSKSSILKVTDNQYGRLS